MDKQKIIETNEARKKEGWTVADMDKVQASIIELYELIAELKTDLLLKKNK